MENRLQGICDTAAALFISRGYARTQMKDIAQALGLSAGMLYVYFKGKQELLDCVLKCAVDPSFLEQDHQFPIQTECFTGLTEEIRAVLEKNHTRFAAPLTRGLEGYTLSQMLSDGYDIIAQYGRGCLVLEKNLRDVGPLGEYYVNYRRTFFADVLRYVTAYLAKGVLRPVPYPELAARQIIESMAWWGMHLRWDTFGADGSISPGAAKEACMDALIHAYGRENE